MELLEINIHDLLPQSAWDWISERLELHKVDDGLDGFVRSKYLAQFPHGLEMRVKKHSDRQCQ